MKALQLGMMAVILVVGADARAASWYAATNGSGGPGTDWSSAFTNIQDALTIAGSNDTIYLAAHTFRCPAQLNWTNSHVSMRGGYAGDGAPGTVSDTPTVLARTGGVMRIMAIVGGTNNRLTGVTITGGTTPAWGGGLLITNVTGLTIDTCVITSNRSSVGGGGIYLQTASSVLITNCLFQANEARSGGDWITVMGGGLYAVDCSGAVAQSRFLSNISVYWGHDAAFGGGLALNGGGWLMDRCTVVSNSAVACPVFGNSWMTSRGAGLYVGNGTHIVRNSLIVSNDCKSGYDGMFGDGVCIGGGSAVLECSTVADNGGEGVRRAAGTAMITNSILWNNGDDVTGTVTLAYSDIEDGDNLGAKGCISSNPLFTNGFRLALGSPCINMGTNQAWMLNALDLAGNARFYQQVDMGAYETFIPLSVSNRPATDLTPTTATLNGSVISTGRAPAHVWVYWGPTDGGIDRTQWANSNYFGVQVVGNLSTNVMLTPPSDTYFCRFCATNEDGEAWASVPAAFSIQEVSVSVLDSSAGELGPDAGAFLLSRSPSVTNDPVEVNFILTGTATEGTDYQAIGTTATIPAGASNVVVAVTPLPDRISEPGGESVSLSLAAGPYMFGAASNASLIIADWVPPAQIYVGSAGSSTYGTNWATAYTNLQQALNIAVSNDALYLAAQTFALPTQLLWTTSYISVQGGYAGDGEPGSLAGPATVLERGGATDARVLLMAGVTNGSLSGVTIRGGATTQRGGGLCISNSLGVLLQDCTLSNNTSKLNGGGVYIVGSTNVSFVTCMIASNKQQDSSGAGYASRCGGGIYAENSYGVFSNTTVKGNVALTDGDNLMSGGGVSLINGGWGLEGCVLSYNRTTAGVNMPQAQGGGVHINGGSHRIRNCLIVGNDGLTGDGICLENGTLVVTHSTVYGNVGEGGRRTAGSLSISNSILWRNMSADVVGAATLGYVDTESGLSNGVNGCISVDPLFGNGVYLSASSPCVDAGSMAAAAAGLDIRTTRSDGALDSGTVDMGYHYPAGITVISDLYVSPSGLNSNDGLSWGTAFRAITKALSVATVGTRVNVAAGTYDTGVETFPLVMNQAGLQLLGTNCDETVINAAGSSQRAITVADVTGGRIEGITIRGGNTTGSGGGLNIFQASDFSIVACVITNNRAGLSGGGAYLYNSPGVSLAGCVVAGNNLGVLVDWDLGYGGGLYVNNSKGVVSNCMIRNNHSYPLGGHAKTRGGGIALVGGYWIVSECEVSSNRTGATLSSANGGAFAYGAGIYAESGTHLIRSSLIVSNDCYQGYDGYNGDGVYMENGAVTLLNCTLANNVGEGIRRAAGAAVVTNSILWDNGDDVVGAVTLAYSDIEDGDNAGTNGCISSSPGFVKGYRLGPDSPCVNTGINQAWMDNAKDLDGHRRLAVGIVDMGAYEKESAGLLILIQ